MNAWGRERAGAVAPAIAVVAFAACYLPFLGKPFHMDDPLFLWAARRIQEDPADFYGFTLNWYGTASAMSDVMKNPPLAAYYLAAAAAALGWSEVALHLAFLLPALGVVLGTYHLAREVSGRPLEAALAAAFTPVFLVSSTTVMCDVLMLCAFVWAVVLWIRGLRGSRPGLLAASAVLALAAGLAKYFGIALVPLLIAYGVARERRIGAWIAWMLIPVVGLALYQLYTAGLYGRGLLLDAAWYAEGARRKEAWRASGKIETGLLFTGGCYLTVLFYLSRLWSRRAIAILGLLSALAVAVIASTGGIGAFSFRDADGLRWGALLQCGLLLAAGASVVALAALDLLAEWRAPEALLLFLWTSGTLLFAVRFNWSVNARSLLPAAPAVGALIVRRIERRQAERAPAPSWRRFWPLVPAAVASVLVAHADHALASSAREAATFFASASRGRTVWFEGHWGFQYYAESLGMRALDYRRPLARPGDLVVKPATNSNLARLPAERVKLLDTTEWPAVHWLAMMRASSGAGFYSDVWGPFPFVVGRVPGERYDLFEVVAPLGP